MSTEDRKIPGKILKKWEKGLSFPGQLWYTVAVKDVTFIYDFN